MHPFPINSSSQNQGYYVFIHEDNSPVNIAPECSGTSGDDGLEWDEEVEKEPCPTVEEDSWGSLYGWYAQMLEQTDGFSGNSSSGLRGIVNQIDSKEKTAAHYAAELGHAGVLRLLLQTDCKVDASDTNGFTPLHIAVRCGQINAVKVLLEATADCNRCTLNSDHSTALHIAAAYGHPHIIDILVSAGSSLEMRDGAERTPLQVAVEEGQIYSAIKLVQVGSNVNVEGVRGSTPLCEAVWQGSIEVVANLLSAGARIPPHHYLLHYATLNSQIEIVKLLVENGASVNLRDDDGDTPLLLAARLGFTQITRLLLENGALVDCPNSLTGSTALHEAVSCSSDFAIFKELFACLQEYNVNLNVICFSGGGDTPLFRAILLKRSQTAKHLIKHGADVNLCSLQHCIVDNLSLAIARHCRSVAQLLVEAGAPPPLEWRYGPRPLSHVARLVIRNNLPSNILYNSIQSLPLPVVLKKFLMFEDED